MDARHLIERMHITYSVVFNGDIICKTADVGIGPLGLNDLENSGDARLCCTSAGLGQNPASWRAPL